MSVDGEVRKEKEKKSKPDWEDDETRVKTRPNSRSMGGRLGKD